MAASPEPAVAAGVASPAALEPSPSGAASPVAPAAPAEAAPPRPGAPPVVPAGAHSEGAPEGGGVSSPPAPALPDALRSAKSALKYCALAAALTPLGWEGDDAEGTVRWSLTFVVVVLGAVLAGAVCVLARRAAARAAASDAAALKAALPYADGSGVSQEWYDAAARLLRGVAAAERAALGVALLCVTAAALAPGAPAAARAAALLSGCWARLLAAFSTRTLFVYGTWGIIMVGFWVPAVVAMAVDLEWCPRATRVLMPFRTQPEVRYGKGDYAAAAKVAVLNHGVLLAVLYALWAVHHWAMPGLCAEELPGALSFTLQFLSSTTLGEAGFYAAHYWMHNSAQGWKVHSVHHSITAPQPIHQHYLHPVEFLILVLFTSSGAPGILPLLCFGSHISVWWAYSAAAIWTGAVGHSGYQIPGLRGLWGSGGNLYHDYHHYHVAGPEGPQCLGQLALFDVVFGTNSFFAQHSWQGRLDKAYPSPGFPIDRVLTLNGVDPASVREQQLDGAEHGAEAPQ